MMNTKRIFGVSPPRSTGLLIARGLVQTAIFWSVFLVLIPGGILLAENRIGISRFDIGTWKYAVVLAFAISGSTCIYCTWLFAKYGKGTPIPFEQPVKLVIAGPYKFVRNPMAVGGITQGVLVGVFLGSWITIVYAVLGALFWNVVARPPEERDLEERFDGDYTAYRSRVRCWLPHMKPYCHEAKQQDE